MLLVDYDNYNKNYIISSTSFQHSLPYGLFSIASHSFGSNIFIPVDTIVISCSTLDASSGAAGIDVLA